MGITNRIKQVAVNEVKRAYPRLVYVLTGDDEPAHEFKKPEKPREEPREKRGIPEPVTPKAEDWRITGARPKELWWE